MQQLYDRVVIVRGGIIVGSRRWLGGRDLLQQMTDGCFVRPIAMHKQSHDRLGKELLQRRLIGWRPSRRRAKDSAGVGSQSVPIHRTVSPARHHSITTV